MFIQKDLGLPEVDGDKLSEFIERWNNTSGTERANYQLFLTELCSLLHLPQPEPATSDTETNAYVFERRVDIANPDGSNNRGFIDLYRRGCFVLEAKQTGKALDSQGWDKAMLAAHNQADNYIRALPNTEGRPPFIVVTDVGRSIELYSEFTRTGGRYVPFPDPGHHRIKLEDLRQTHIQDRLRRLWLEPESLDPSKYAARVTREVSAKLAELAKSLEAGGYDVERVAHFLKRCLFTMFAEDVALIPEYSFTQLLERLLSTPEHFVDSMTSLWSTMNDGGFEGQLMHKLPRFNGGLFKGIDPIPLNKEQIQLLVDAAKYDWRYVEPAIFGTLLERALDPRERHKLGAHYTPRAYVERLVMPTLIDPLREQWATVQVAVEAWLQKDDHKKALKELHEFHHHLCELKVLDPACGSGNFLYVALEHLKRLEGEVLNLISDLSAGQVGFETQGLTVDPHQFLGIEINPRAAAIAEIVLWIGYLQWHYRIHGKLDLPDPILKDFHNIENRDALITYQSREPMLNEQGEPQTIWDGISYKTSPVTGELIPDETQRKTVYHYEKPEKAPWPQADYIVGNPPYIGARKIRMALGDGYLAALRSTYSEIPENADYVMYWWDKSAYQVGQGDCFQFGLITTNSLRQSFCRKVVDLAFARHKSLGYSFVIPDHPWVDSNDGAAVRVTLSTVGQDVGAGVLSEVVAENSMGDGEVAVGLDSVVGQVSPNLTIDFDPADAEPLQANEKLSCVGYQLTGKGFVVDDEQRNQLIENHPEAETKIRALVSGRDITQSDRGLYAIDLFGLSLEDLISKYPSIYQWVLERVKPERNQNNRAALRSKWWIFGEARSTFRPALRGVASILTTSLTAKHRVFKFASSDAISDSTTVMFALSGLEQAGVLFSRIHVVWSLAAGGTLEDRPRYNKAGCFETFPFPELSQDQKVTISAVSEKLDAHRKKQQQEYPKLKITDMYNVLEKLRAEEPLSDKEKQVHEQGLVSILKELHDDLDRAVFDAYDWSDLGDKLVGLPGATTPLADKSEAQAEAEEELLSRLVALNHQRAAEEAQGHIRWLRPEYQAPDSVQADIKLEAGEEQQAAPKQEVAKKLAWPKEMKDQVNILLEQLQAAPQSEEALAERFKRKPIKSVSQVLSALEALGRIQSMESNWFLVG
jgi:hypothetical protein